jgi:hypothetical protein
MKFLRCSAFALLFAASAFAGTVSQSLLNLVMPDSTILSGAQVNQLTASPFGQHLLSQFQPSSSGFLSFISATGFDPRYDLQYVLAATSAQSGGGHQGLIVGVGTFVPSKIQAAATSAGATVSQYKNITIIAGPARGTNSQQTSLAFLDSQTIAIGSLTAVQGAIDRKTAGAVFSGPLATQALTVSGTYQAWFATVTPLSDFLNGKLSNLGNLSQNNLFQSIEQSSGGINLASSGVTVTADLMTATPQNAQAVVNVLQFLLSMVENNNQNQSPNLGTLADATTFNVSGSTAHIVLALTEQQAEQLIQPRTKNDARQHKPAN